jgi:hypothetical protein
MKSTKYLAWIIGLICGVELVLAIVLGGAAVSTIFGLEGAMVASLLAIGTTLTLGGWAYTGDDESSGANTHAAIHQG